MVGFIPIVVGSAVGLAAATVVIPAAVGAAGFTGAGIAAGSLASQMMSAAAIANGGGVAAGSTVAVLQSIGAAGLSLATKGAITAVGGGTCFLPFKVNATTALPSADTASATCLALVLPS